jgi:hypothetical protein
LLPRHFLLRQTVEEAENKICPAHEVFAPEPESQEIYDSLYVLYQGISFAFGRPEDAQFGDVLPALITLSHDLQIPNATRQADY